MNNQELNFVLWRWDMWTKGYGSYTEIERQVKNKELIPGKEYPTLHIDAPAKETLYKSDNLKEK